MEASFVVECGSVANGESLYDRIGQIHGIGRYANATDGIRPYTFATAGVMRTDNMRFLLLADGTYGQAFLDEDTVKAEAVRLSALVVYARRHENRIARRSGICGILYGLERTGLASVARRVHAVCRHIKRISKARRPHARQDKKDLQFHFDFHRSIPILFVNVPISRTRKLYHNPQKPCNTAIA